MAVSPNRKGEQFRLGARLGDPSFIVTHWPKVDHKTIIPDEAVSGLSSGEIGITIYASDGTTELLAETAMTGNTPGRYLADLSTTASFPLGTGYQVRFRFAYSGTETNSVAKTFEVRRLLGIYSALPEAMVTDEDLTEDIFELNDYLDETQEDWSAFVAEAWNYVLGRLARIRREDATYLDPYTIADGTEIYLMHKLRTMWKICTMLRSTDGERFGLLAQNYREEFEDEFLRFENDQLTKWAEGPTTETEVDESGKIRGPVSDGTLSTTTVDSKKVTTLPLRFTVNSRF